MALSAAVRKGRLEGLVALRDALAVEIEHGPPDGNPSQTATLARQLRETLREIEELEKAKPRKGSSVDDLEKRRRRRRSAAARAGAAGDGGDERRKGSG